MGRQVSAPPDAALIKRIKDLMTETAARYDIPKVYITAHVRYPKADIARKEVWRVLINEWGMKRHHVAKLYGRDLRRLRASVLGRSPAGD
jgi:hypothetical protein